MNKSDHTEINLKVAMVEPIGGHRGNEFYDFGLCKSLQEVGVDVSLYTCDETRLHIKHQFKFNVYLFFKKIYGSENKYIRGIRYVFGALKTASHANKSNNKLVHLHIYHFANREYLNLLLFRRNKFKVVATVHDVEAFDKFGKKINANKYKKFEIKIDEIIVHSNYAKESLLKYFTNTPENKIHVVPILDIDFLYKSSLTRVEARKKLNLPQNDKLILFFGQIKKVKGLDILLKAFALIRKQSSNVKLIITGIPWKVSFDEFQKIIDDNDMRNEVIINLNYIPNETIPVYYNACDITVLPYRKIYSSAIIIRSLDYGAAIIASNLDVFKNIITENVNGILFENENHVELSNKIQTLINDDEKINYLKTNALKTIQENYNSIKNALFVKEIYMKAINE